MPILIYQKLIKENFDEYNSSQYLDIYENEKNDDL